MFLAIMNQIISNHMILALSVGIFIQWNTALQEKPE